MASKRLQVKRLLQNEFNIGVNIVNSISTVEFTKDTFPEVTKVKFSPVELRKFDLRVSDIFDGVPVSIDWVEETQTLQLSYYTKDL
jgi:hypothetical protein